ncbi:MAG TPA: hypothetical protein VFI74_03115 [Candidatus Saccharimonadales bacterium]|nr:hypothetical protein [Candidatus Saccharimonadales bacterium]
MDSITMALSKKILHDKLVLTLLSANAFLAIACTLLVLLRFGADGSSDYIVQFRENLGIGAFKTGSLGGILSFIVYAVLVASLNIWLSLRVYKIRRQLAVSILALGVILLTLAFIISNLLLGSR